MNFRTTNRIVSTLVHSLAALLFLASISSCASDRDRSEDGFYARVVVTSSDPETRPIGFAEFRENGDQVIFTSTGIEFEAGRGEARLINKVIPANYARAKLKEHGIDWTGLPGQKLPFESAAWFSDEEKTKWELEFEEHVPPPAPDVPEITSNPEANGQEECVNGLPPGACGAPQAALVIAPCSP